MLRKLLLALVVWLAVAIGLFLVGTLLLHVAEPTTRAIGGFLKQFAGLIGFLCALVWYFFGDNTLRRV